MKPFSVTVHLPDETLGLLAELADDLGVRPDEAAALILVGWSKRRQERKTQEEAHRS